MTTGTKLLILGGPAQRSIESALDVLPLEPGGQILLAAAHRRLIEQSGLTDSRALADAIRRRGATVRAIAPASTTAGAWLRSRSTEWRAVDISHRASRLSRVTLPSALAQAGTVIAVNRIAAGDHEREAIAVGIWSRFAHPSQRLGARLSDPRDGLIAEIALAVRPALILLFATWNELPILVASNDLIAAELAGLAVRQRLAEPVDEPIGPWEHPLVQHATELGLGAATPGEIDATIRWLGDPESAAGKPFRSFAIEILGRIGVENDD